MPNIRARRCIDRIISREFRQSDIRELFLFAREHHDGRKSVREFGDFVAHPQRDRGIINQTTRDWSTVVNFHMPRMVEGAGADLKSEALPPGARDYFFMAALQMDPKFLRERTGFRPREAHSIAAGVAERLAAQPGGLWALPRDLNAAEIKVVTVLATHITPREAFNHVEIVRDFMQCMKSNKLLTREEAQLHQEYISKIIRLGAVTILTNSAMQIGDGRYVKLEGFPILEQCQIQVLAPISGFSLIAPEKTVATSVFSIPDDPAACCDGTLHEGFWDFDVEVEAPGLIVRC